MSRVEPLVLRAGDVQRLREWTRSSTIPAGLAQRARIVSQIPARITSRIASLARALATRLPTTPRGWQAR